MKNKNGDGYNNRVSNLVLVAKSQKQHRSIQLGRQDFGYLTTVDRSGWKKNYSRRIPVKQYPIKGKLINRCKSITEVHEKTGFDPKGIGLAAKGFYNGMWRGFKWKSSLKSKSKSP